MLNSKLFATTFRRTYGFVCLFLLLCHFFNSEISITHLVIPLLFPCIIYACVYLCTKVYYSSDSVIFYL